jgi:hypothetical protein
MAASEVERSGTRVLSGFMRAERDTLRRGEAGGGGCSLDVFGGGGRVFSSGDKRDKEGDRETYRCCKTLYAWALAIRTRRKPRLFLPESRAYFSRAAESRAYFSWPQVCEKSPSRESRAYFSWPQVCEKSPSRESRAYFSWLN